MPKETGLYRSNILTVINPISGDIEKDGIISVFDNYVKERGFRYKVFYTTGDDDENEIKNLLKSGEFETVVAVGGDGTCNLVARTLLDTDIRMAVIPVGSANGLAKELSIPRETEESVQLLGNGKILKMDVLIINKSHLSLHLSDLGVNARLIKRFDEDTRRGFYGYLKHFFNELFRSEMMNFKMVIDGRNITKRAHALVIANATMYGTGAVINPKGKINDGFFEVILIKPYSLWQFARMVVRFLSGKLHESESVDVYHCRSLTLFNREKHLFQIDGEIIGNPEVITVDIKPQSLAVIVPSDYPI